MPLVRVLILLLATFPLFADDVTLGWISREPALEYVWGSSNPTRDGWPLAGSTVTWRAHVKNWTARPIETDYVWRIDDVEVARGKVTLAPNAQTTVDLTRMWSFDRTRITFALVDREMTVFSDALAVGFWVEQKIYDYFRAHQAKLGVGSSSFEEWAQRTVDLYNDMAALAIYEETPNGVHDRWRLQKIVIVPDGTLPLSGVPFEGSTPGAGAETHPDQLDRTVDLMWGFPATRITSFHDVKTADPSNEFYASYFVWHELGHARYLVDLYAWNVHHRGPHYLVAIEENGTLIIEKLSKGGSVHRTPEQGLMNAQYTFIDRYSAIALNFLAGRRATLGNYNEPQNFASFLNDFPAQNRVTIRDRNGNPIANADVWIYQSVANSPAWYATHYDNEPDLKVRTDDAGRVLVGRSPFARDGKVVHTFGMTNGVAIVRVAKENAVEWGSLESRLFNLEYWRGHTQFAEHELVVGLQCDARGPVLRDPDWGVTTRSEITKFQWSAVPGATQYRVYASANLGKPQLIGTTTDTRLEAKAGFGRIYWHVEADLGACGVRRSDSRMFEARVPFGRRRSVGR